MRNIRLINNCKDESKLLQNPLEYMLKTIGRNIYIIKGHMR